MTYIEQFNAELTKKLEATDDTAAIVQWVSGKMLESYKNGIIAGRKEANVMSKGKRGQKTSCMYDHDHTKNNGRDCVWHN